MHPRRLALSCTLLALVVAVPGGAEEEPVGAHSRHPRKVVVLDAERISPSELTMGQGDVIVFENQSIEPIIVTFVEPKDVGEKIRCTHVRRSERHEPPAPWLLFQRSGDNTVAATIPPGRFASMCSLSPGRYSYTAGRQRLKTTDAGGILRDKGQITVQ